MTIHADKSTTQCLAAILRDAFSGSPTPLEDIPKNVNSRALGQPEKDATNSRLQMYKPLIIALFFCVSACGSVLNSNDDAQPKPGMGQIIIRRVGNFVLSGNASVEINGQKVVTLASQERYVADIAPGDTSVSVSPALFGSGRFTITFKSEAGKTYRLAVVSGGDDLAGPLPDTYKITETGGTFRIGRSN
jgi:hypothetical protein